MYRITGRILSITGSVAILAALSPPAMATFIPVPEPSTLLLLAAGVGAALLIGNFGGRK